MSEPGETRTLDPRIKSALLYRLSYRLIEAMREADSKPASRREAKLLGATMDDRRELPPARLIQKVARLARPPIQAEPQIRR